MTVHNSELICIGAEERWRWWLNMEDHAQHSKQEAAGRREHGHREETKGQTASSLL